MPAIPSRVSDAEQIPLIWRQRRNNAAQFWRDAQWTKFDRICNEEVQQITDSNATITRKLDAELSRALTLLHSE